MASSNEFKAQGKYLHAIQICEQLLNEYPNNSDIHFELAGLYELSGNLNSSFYLLETYLVNNPDDKEVRFYYGQFLLKNQKWNKAVEIFSQFIPEEKPIALFFLGYSYFMIKDFEMARINYLDFLTLEADSELVNESYLYLAKIEIELKDYEQALAYIKKSELLHNAYWELHLIYAICYYHLGMDTHAVLSIEKSIKLNSKAISTYEWAGRIFFRAKEYEKAENHFIKFMEFSNEVSSQVYAELGEVFLHTNKKESALNYFDLALNIDPNNKTALIGRENILGNFEPKISKDV